MELFEKVFNAFWTILLMLEPNAQDEANVFNQIFAVIAKLFNK